MDFEVNIITSFKGVTLEVGGDLETYWKSTAVVNVPSTHLFPLRTPRRPNHLGSVQASPVVNTNIGGGQTWTISSLQGDYVYVVVQVTRDLQPVVYFNWLLPNTDFDLGVSDVTLAQFETLAKTLGRNDIGAAGKGPTGWARSLSQSMVSLDSLLKVRSTHSAAATYLSVF